jgi:hypothetical protein
MIKSKFFQLAVCLLITGSFLQAQNVKVEREGLFGSKINNPITVEVSKIATKYVFYAHNESYYPYTVHLKVTDIVNLSPTIVDKKIKAAPGRNTLVELQMQDLNRPVTYRYDFTYSIGVPSTRVDLSFSYLIPVKKAFDIHYNSDEEKLFYNDHFKLSKGDTVYAMRKGKVVATPDMFSGQDRISKNESFEIMHKDGTFMVYENIDPEYVFIKAGKQVYPGQPIGLLGELPILEVILYRSLGDGYLEELIINYSIDEKRTEAFSEELKSLPVMYHESIITKEFTKREMKSFEKGELLQSDDDPDL